MERYDVITVSSIERPVILQAESWFYNSFLYRQLSYMCDFYSPQMLERARFFLQFFLPIRHDKTVQEHSDTR